LISRRVFVPALGGRFVNSAAQVLAANFAPWGHNFPEAMLTITQGK